ncbi:MAG: hypothetical protein K2V38_01125, partial [Gemmataceae bacterium]|nr:hypothetical protein [Gemmataceae bacterium]
PPPPMAEPVPGGPVRGGAQPVNLTEGMEGLFFLTKHHGGDFYTISPLMPPTDAKAADYKAQVEQVKKGAAVLAEPVKGLKAEKAADRFFAAHVLVTKYRTYPETGGEVEIVKVPAEESKLILAAVAEANWQPDPNAPAAPNPFQTFSQLGLTEKDGWKPAMVKLGEDFIDKSKEAFVAWLAGAGKDYQINKLAPKAK